MYTACAAALSRSGLYRSLVLRISALPAVFGKRDAFYKRPRAVLRQSDDLLVQTFLQRGADGIALVFCHFYRAGAVIICGDVCKPQPVRRGGDVEPCAAQGVLGDLYGVIPLRFGRRGGGRFACRFGLPARTMPRKG